MHRRTPNRNDSRFRKEWLSHGYFRTYQIAQRVVRLAGDRDFFVRRYETISDPEELIDYIRPWQKETLVHKFAYDMADDMFEADTDGNYVRLHTMDETGAVTTVRVLPVDLGLNLYGLRDGYFEIPKDLECSVEGNVRVWRDSHSVADACYDYFRENLSLSEPYDRLLKQLADEVFHILFLNRGTMADLNQQLASAVVEVGALRTELDPELRSLFTSSGRLKRKRVPKWARDAVYFRERGRCASCARDLTGLLDALPDKQFDHIVPLTEGGLNDVSNLQLLCADCNRAKSDTLTPPSKWYRRWYDIP
ncbi:HNH endonuclease [Amycolatopsis thermoflava]|uniref:HNH endonuclease n=1 Tax=Amycolatopsis thermoflava TaxID=84480 RepID=UPI00364F74BB